MIYYPLRHHCLIGQPLRSTPMLMRGAFDPATLLSDDGDGEDDGKEAQQQASVGASDEHACR